MDGERQHYIHHEVVGVLCKRYTYIKFLNTLKSWSTYVFFWIFASLKFTFLKFLESTVLTTWQMTTLLHEYAFLFFLFPCFYFDFGVISFRVNTI